jgi:hypothetical protein
MWWQKILTNFSRPIPGITSVLVDRIDGQKVKKTLAKQMLANALLKWHSFLWVASTHALSGKPKATN